MKKPKIFLVWTCNSGVVYYRMMNFVKHMRDDFEFGFSKWRPDFQNVAEWEFKIKDPQMGPLIQKDIDTLSEGCDMAICQKFHSIGGLCFMDYFKDRFPEKKLYSEFDDNVFDVNPCSAAYESYHPGSDAEEIAREQMELSTGLIVSTNHLRKTYEKFNPNVWIVPNAIDFDIWDDLKKPKKKGKKVRIGWAGGGAHNDDLKFIEPSVKAILEKYKNAEFVFLGGAPDDFLKHERIISIRKWFPINDYPYEINKLGFDVMIAPLRDNNFNRSKSNLRVMEGWALKLPVLASDVEPYKCVENGVTGLLATETDEWTDALERLVCDEKLRKKLGKAGYEKCKADYDVEQVSKTYSTYIKLMLQGKGNISPEAGIRMLTT